MLHVAKAQYWKACLLLVPMFADHYPNNTEADTQYFNLLSQMFSTAIFFSTNASVTKPLPGCQMYWVIVDWVLTGINKFRVDTVSVLFFRMTGIVSAFKWLPSGRLTGCMGFLLWTFTCLIAWAINCWCQHTGTDKWTDKFWSAIEFWGARFPNTHNLTDPTLENVTDPTPQCQFTSKKTLLEVL